MLIVYCFPESRTHTRLTNETYTRAHMRVGCLSKLALALHLDPSQCLVMENFCLLPDGARFMVDMGHSGLGWILRRVYSVGTISLSWGGVWGCLLTWLRLAPSGQSEWLELGFRAALAWKFFKNWKRR